MKLKDMSAYLARTTQRFRGGSRQEHPRLAARVRAANILLICGTVALFVGYLALNNRTTADSFEIRSLERRIVELEEAKRSLDLEMLDRQAMGNIESRVRELGFVPVEDVSYLTTTGGAVAVK